MDKNKLKEEISKIFSDKKISNLVAILLVLVFALIAINVFMPNLQKNNKNEETTVAEQENSENTNKSNYEEEQKTELTNLLRKMQGVGEVKVMMTFESGEVKVPAYDSSTQTTTTEETDKEGGKRENKQTNGDTKVVMTTEGGANEPFITQTNKPKVIGVAVMAEGAEVSKVRSNKEKVVSNLYNLSYDKVNVYPMK